VNTGTDLFGAPRRVRALADLFANVWQFGYVTNDLDRAIAFMSDRFGLEHCLKLPAGGTFFVRDQPGEFEAKFAMGSRGGTIIELIEPVDGVIDFYTRSLPANGEFAVRLHHIATFMETGDAEWERITALLADANLTVDYTLVIPGRVRAGYVDTTAELGHWLEICQLHREDIDFFTSLVADSA
jgi:Glyoxalase/Bleomycin resistance protein/Dioxygenase superfamily